MNETAQPLHTTLCHDDRLLRIATILLSAVLSSHNHSAVATITQSAEKLLLTTILLLFLWEEPLLLATRLLIGRGVVGHFVAAVDWTSSRWAEGTSPLYVTRCTWAMALL